MGKYKVGDIVRIRSKAWIDAQEKGEDWSIRNNGALHIKTMLLSMQAFAGKEAEVRSVTSDEVYRISVDNEVYWWADWMFEDPAEPDILSPEEAARAMLNGEVLVDPFSNEYCWNKNRFVALLDKEFHDLVYVSDRLRRRHAKRKRPMNRWEILAWANSDESRGWVVRQNVGFDWTIPPCLRYDMVTLSFYQRARLLPDLSGVDESTIQGFEVEV
jgi:hypothetical protein